MYQNLAETLKRKGHRVVVLAGYSVPRNILAKPYSEAIGGLTVYRLPLVPFPRCRPYFESVFPPNLKSVFFLISFLKNTDFNIYHLHGYGHLFIDSAAIMLKILKKKYFFTSHGFPTTPKKQGGFLNFFYVLYNRFLGRKTLFWSERISCVSYRVAENALICKLKAKTSEIPNGVDEFFLKSRKRVGFKNSGVFKILSIGRYYQVKGYDCFISCLGLLKSRLGFENFVYKVVGDDFGEKERLEGMISKLKLDHEVCLLDRLNREEVFKLYHESNLYVQPSLFESFGISVLEAMAVGCPPLVSLNCGVADFLKDGYNCFLFSTDQKPLETAKLLKKIIDDKEKRQKISENAKLSTLEFSWDKVTDKYCDFWDGGR